MFRRAISLALVLCLAGCYARSNIGVNRGFDEYDEEMEYESTMSPDAFADRLGEPDEWRNEGEGANLRMTAIWKCLKGERREVTWRMGQSDRGRQGWQVISDTRGEGDCGGS